MRGHLEQQLKSPTYIDLIKPSLKQARLMLHAAWNLLRNPLHNLAHGSLHHRRRRRHHNRPHVPNVPHVCVCVCVRVRV